MSKSIAHIIKHANFQLCGTYPAGVVWKNRQLTTNIYTKRAQIFINQTKYVSKITSWPYSGWGAKRPPMEGREGTDPIKHGPYIPLPPQLNPQLLPYRAKVFHFPPPFCIFPGPPYWSGVLAMPPTIFSLVKVRISSF